MSRLWKGFSSYTIIGVANTVIHWQLFFVFRAAFELSQAVSNLLAFCIAASFSFYVNALYTFSVPISVPRYALFMLCMGQPGLRFFAVALGGVSRASAMSFQRSDNCAAMAAKTNNGM